jgi:MipA family protein
MAQSTPFVRAALSLAAGLLLATLSMQAAHATVETDAITELLTEPGSTGLGFALRVSPSPYLGATTKADALPLYLYEGERVFLRSSRAGVKALTGQAHQLDVFVDKRLEGYPLTSPPDSLAGLEVRSNSTDVGATYRYRQQWGALSAEYLRDVSRGHHGSEIRLGYGYDLDSGAWRWRPSVTLARRDAKLNDYYFGVRPNEAAPGRPAYRAGAGVNTTLALDGSYALSRGWRVLGGVSATLLSGAVQDSPIVDRRVLPAVYLGVAYELGAPNKPANAEAAPIAVKALYGRSTEDGCHLVRILTLRCFSTASNDRTNIAGIQIGKPFAQNWNGWPVDLYGYAGLTRHDERGLQSNGLQADLFMKGYYYGFPWANRIKTRVGLGIGASLAQRAPYIEAKTQADRGEPASRLLNYLDPTVDISVGDVIGVRSLKDTYVGVGVSHRSGAFGTSRLFNSVSGGSNYIYSYLETAF